MPVNRYMSEGNSGNEFMEAFENYGDAIFRFCLLKVSNKELAEDMTQEVFIRYLQSLRMGKEMTNTRAYLYTIANNLAKDWYKKKKPESLDKKIEEGFEPAATDHTEQEAEYSHILSVLHTLPEKDQEILLLRFVEGLDPKDIASMFDDTANNISVRINRAIKRLQKQLHV